MVALKVHSILYSEISRFQIAAHIVSNTLIIIRNLFGMSAYQQPTHEAVELVPITHTESLLVDATHIQKNTILYMHG